MYSSEKIMTHLSVLDYMGPTALKPSCMKVSPAGLIWLSFFRPSLIFDLHNQITVQGQHSVNKDRYSFCMSWLTVLLFFGGSTTEAEKENLRTYLSPVSGSIITALAEKTM